MSKKKKKEHFDIFKDPITTKHFESLVLSKIYTLDEPELRFLCEMLSIHVVSWEKNGRFMRFRLTNEFFDTDSDLILSQWWDVMSDSTANIHRILSEYFKYIDYNNTLERFNGDFLEIYSQEDLVKFHRFFFEGFAYYMEKEGELLKS